MLPSLIISKKVDVIPTSALPITCKHRLLALKAFIVEVLVEMQSLSHLHCIDQLSMPGALLWVLSVFSAGPDYPVSFIGQLDYLRLTSDKSAVTPLWIRRNTTVMFNNVGEESALLLGSWGTIPISR